MDNKPAGIETTRSISQGKPIGCSVHQRKSKLKPTPSALSEVFAHLSHPSILGGNQAIAATGRFSYWTAEPKEVFEFRTGEQEPFEKLQGVLSKYTLKEKCSESLPSGMFTGGWIGYFGYELGRYIDKLPATTIDDISMPLIRLCFYDRLIAYDHANDIFLLIALSMANDPESPEEKLTSLERLLAEAHDHSIADMPAANLAEIDLSQTRCNMPRDYFMRMFDKIKRHIYDGDVYQINFSQRFESDFQGRPIDLYHWENRYNPAPYAAYIDTGQFQVVSTSPELFVEISDGRIQTKPIKGTRPHISENLQDCGYARLVNQNNYRELLNSEKERAELNMIIDLERNDVARICEPGTRGVLQGRTIETYATVFHAVATVGGRLRAGTTFCDVLKAMFPGGSITGAPKIRAMEIIDEIEPTARGLYTGSIGYISLDGSVCLNIAIRTAIITGQKAYVQTGSGIVADSDAQAEWDETITKAKALLAGIKATCGCRDRVLELHKNG